MVDEKKKKKTSVKDEMIDMICNLFDSDTWRAYFNLCPFNASLFIPQALFIFKIKPIKTSYVP